MGNAIGNTNKWIENESKQNKSKIITMQKNIFL